MKKLIPQDSILVPDSAELVFEGQIFSVFQWQQELFDDSHATFEMLRRPDTTNVVCVDGEKIITINDEQPNRGSKKSLPGGRVDPEDVDILAAAQREVLEEIGYKFKNWRLVRVSQPVHKIEWFIYVFLAWEVTDTQPTHHDAGEKIILESVSFDELKQLVSAKTGYFAGEIYELFEDIHSMEDLMNLPEAAGREVDR